MSERIQLNSNDEIDLGEIIKILIKRKYVIIGFTFIITLGAIVLSLTRTPIYEAKALIEIGEYAVNSNNSNNSNSSNGINNKVSLDNEDTLSKKLNILFIDTSKNIKNKKSEITDISVPKRVKGFLEIKAEAISNRLAKEEIDKVVRYIKKQHQLVLDDIKQKRELETEILNKKITNLNKIKIPSFENNIKLREESLSLFKQELNQIDNIIQKIQKKDSSLAALKIMEKSNLLKLISESESNLFYLKDQLDILKTEELNDYIEKKNILESLMLPHNYKNTEVIGQVLTNENPIKPKKKLVVLISFITSLIFSIFLVFMMEFILTFKKGNN